MNHALVSDSKAFRFQTNSNLAANILNFLIDGYGEDSQDFSWTCRVKEG